MRNEIATHFFPSDGNWMRTQGDENKRLIPSRIIVLFLALILACGHTLIAGLITLWSSVDGYQGILKAATAAVPGLTALDRNAGGGVDGSGRGLTIVARAMEHLDWHIYVDSVATQGTRSTISIPNDQIVSSEKSWP